MRKNLNGKEVSAYLRSEIKKEVEKLKTKPKMVDIDKVKETGLTPIFSENGVYFNEAETVFCCKKIHEQFIIPEGFVDKSIEQNYTAKDYHKMYIGEITAVYKK